MTALHSPSDSSGHTEELSSLPLLLDVRSVARLVGCSTKHIRRMVRAGKLPTPVKVGRLTRWSRASLESWIAAGCKLAAPEGGGR